MKKFLLLFVLLVGCGPTDIASTNAQVQYMEYYKDNRTGLCFVRNYVGDGHGGYYNVFTYVPCTPEVEKYLVK
jgi:hypothetical protein